MRPNFLILLNIFVILTVYFSLNCRKNQEEIYCGVDNSLFGGNIDTQYVEMMFKAVSDGDIDTMFKYWNQIEDSQFVDDEELDKLPIEKKILKFKKSEKEDISKGIKEEILQDYTFHKGYEPYKSLIGYENFNTATTAREFNAIMQRGIKYKVVGISSPKIVTYKKNINNVEKQLRYCELFAVVDTNYENCVWKPSNKQRETAIELRIKIRFVKFFDYGRSTYSFENVDEILKVKLFKDDGTKKYKQMLDEEISNNSTLPKIIIADSGNKRIVGIDDIQGSNWREYNENADDLKFRTIGGITVDKENKIYFSDYSFEKDSKGKIFCIENIISKKSIQYVEPNGPILGIAIDSKGNIIYHNQTNIAQINTINDNKAVYYKPDENYLENGDVKINDKDQIYFTDLKNEKLYRIDDISGKNMMILKIDSSESKRFSVAFNTDNSILFPFEIGKNGRLYLSIFALGQINEYYDFPSGNKNLFDSTKTSIQTRNISNVAVDNLDRIWFSELGGSKIYRIDSISGNNILTYGNLGSERGQFKNITYIWAKK